MVELPAFVLICIRSKAIDERRKSGIGVVRGKLRLELVKRSAHVFLFLIDFADLSLCSQLILVRPEPHHQQYQRDDDEG